MAEWHYSKNGQRLGPVPLASLQQILARGEVSGSDFAWTQGMSAWARIAQVPERAAVLGSGPQTPPPLPVQPLDYAAPGSARSVADDAAMRWLLPVGRSGLAIAAGYAGLFAVIPFLAPVALILSVLALRDMRRNPHKHGMGRAIFGLIMGILFTALLGLILGRAALHR